MHFDSGNRGKKKETYLDRFDKGLGRDGVAWADDHIDQGDWHAA